MRAAVRAAIIPAQVPRGVECQRLIASCDVRIHTGEMLDGSSLSAGGFRLKLVRLPRIGPTLSHRIGRLKVRVGHWATAKTAELALDRVSISAICTLV